MKKRYRTIGMIFMKSLTGVLYLGAFLVLGFVVSPWKVWLADYLESVLAQQGFDNPSLTVDGVSGDTLSLSRITVGKLTLNDVNIHYEPEALWNGKLRGVVLDGLHVSVIQAADGWQVQGIALKPASTQDAAASPVSGIPMTQAALKALPFDTLDIAKSVLTLTGLGWDARMPFSLSLREGVTFTAQNIHFKYGKTSVNIPDFEISAQLKADDTGWEGQWRASNVALSSMPAFDMNGTLTLDLKGLALTGTAQAKDQSGMKGRFHMGYNFENALGTILALDQMSMPWGGGVVSVKNVSVPVFGNKALTFPVRAAKVSIDDVMRLMTGEYVRATGTISGVLPVIVGRDGSVSLGSGALKADQKGQLSMPPEIIPGQGAQIELTRNILKNFEYEGFQVDVTQEAHDEISVLLALQGHNPDLYNGRAVHLNVRLGGDVLDFIRSNVMMIMQPETLLNQEQK
tara:strand:+ start:16137 stop:17510 length:1374 start_codon:yes stop_codon:yes gene_type:complete